MKRLAVFVATVMAALAVPAVAEAHHVSGGSATCTLVGNTPTINAQAQFVSFDSSNKPINGVLKVDSKVVQTVTGFTFAGANGTWYSASIPTTPGSHSVVGTFTWPYQDGQNGTFTASVNCPTPPQPTPTPTPSPTPTPTPPPVTPTPTPVPPTPTPTPPVPPHIVPPPKKCPDTSNKRYRIVAQPKHLSHGLQSFHLRGPYIRHARWYVDMQRQHNSRWGDISRDTKTFKVWLFDQQTWGRDLWGWHWVTVQAAVGPPGCGHTASVRLHFFNNDPLV